ncbi:MAG: hypothetical protein WA376_04410 [Terrimicrobiaceae bacterium]
MIRRSLLGIFRETLHSPERIFDDYEILRLTGEVLRGEGLEVKFFRPEQIARSIEWWSGSPPDVAFLMCEQERLLEPLGEWERQGAILINSVEAIRNTYRYRMIPLLSASMERFPASELISTDTRFQESRLRALFRRSGSGPFWIKRGDVHNTQPGDVSLARSADEVRARLAAFKSRGVAQAVLQEHIEGDLVKLYGVGQSGETWFRWFYHKDQELKRHRFSEEALRGMFFEAARTLDLEVFGGDAVVTSGGSIYLIDINAWPSFALFRSEASVAIARHILSRIPETIAAS